jgi:hypothetical protein
VPQYQFFALPVIGKNMIRQARRMLLTTIITTVVGAVFVPATWAQRPFEKLREGFDDWRPRGELLRKIFGDEDGGSGKDKGRDTAASAGEKKGSGQRQQPTPAEPGVIEEMQQRAKLAQQHLKKQLQQSLFPQDENQPPHPSRSASSQASKPAPAQFAGWDNQFSGQRRQPTPALKPADATGFMPLPQPPRPHRPGERNDEARKGSGSAAAAPSAPPGEASKIDLGMVIRQSGSTDKPEGLLIERLDSDGLAARSGLKRGDVIVAIGGIESNYEADFQSILEVMRPGDQIELQIRRTGKTEKVMLQFGPPPEVESGLEFSPAAQPPGAAQGSVGDLNMDFSEVPPLDHVASLTASIGDTASPVAEKGRLRSVLVDEPWPQGRGSYDRR